MRRETVSCEATPNLSTLRISETGITTNSSPLKTRTAFVIGGSRGSAMSERRKGRSTSAPLAVLSMMSSSRGILPPPLPSTVTPGSHW